MLKGCAVLSLLCLFALTVCHADESKVKLEEVVVTATRSQERAIETPASVEVVGRDLIARIGAPTIDKAMEDLPGVYLKRSKGLSDIMPTVSMRGFYGSDRNLILIDGLPAPKGWSWSRLPSASIGRIEVAKGAFSALYGERAMGGVVNLITVRPHQPTLKVDLSAAERGTKVYEISLGDGNEKVGCLLSAVKRRTDGYPTIPVLAKPYKGKTEPKGEVIGFEETKDRKGNTVYLVGDTGKNWYKDESYNLKLDWKPNGENRLSFKLWHCDFNYGYQGGESYLKDAQTLSAVRSGVFKLKGSNVKVKVSETQFTSSYGGEPVDMFGASFKHSLGKKGEVGLIAEWDRTEHWWVSPSGSYTSSPERNLRIEIHSALREIIPRSKLNVGADLREGKVDAKRWTLENWLDRSSASRLNLQTKGKVVSAGIYAQEELMLMEKKLKLFLGGRLDVWKVKDGYNREWRDKEKRYIEDEFDERSEMTFSPKASVVYNPDDVTSLRASIGSSFRGPEVGDLYKSWYFWGRLYLCNPELGPERGYSAEVGIDRKIGDLLRARATLFYNRMKDLIYYRSFSDEEVKAYNERHGTSYKRIKRKENVASAESKGVELGANLKPIGGISPFLTLTYTHTEVLENPANPDSVGKRLPRIPDLICSAGFDLNRSPLSGRITARYVSKAYTEDDNSDVESGVYGVYDPHFVVDLSLSCSITDRTSITLAVENLLNEEYYQHYKAPGRTIWMKLSREIR